MGKKLGKILSAMVVVCAVLTLMPVSARAESGGAVVRGITLNAATPYLLNDGTEAIAELPVGTTTGYVEYTETSVILHKAVIEAGDKNGISFQNFASNTIEVDGDSSISSTWTAVSDIRGNVVNPITITTGSEKSGNLTLSGRYGIYSYSKVAISNYNGNIEINATDGNGILAAEVPATISINGDLTLTGGDKGISCKTLDMKVSGDMTANESGAYGLYSLADMNVTVEGDITSTSNLVSKGNINLSIGGNVNINGNITAQNDCTIDAGGEIAVDNGINGGTIAGTLNISGTVAEGTKLVTSNMNLVVPENKTLTNHGTIIMDAGTTVTKTGSLTGNDPIYDIRTLGLDLSSDNTSEQIFPAGSGSIT